jgi:hypothetical protein
MMLYRTAGGTESFSASRTASWSIGSGLQVHQHLGEVPREEYLESMRNGLRETHSGLSESEIHQYLDAAISA